MFTEQFAKSFQVEIIRLCHRGLGSKTLRLELLKRLKAIVPFDYAYFSTTDPATQLITNSLVPEQPPTWVMSVFLENEFLKEDFLKFRSMLNRKQPVGVLSDATQKKLNRSQRYREVLAPLAMNDELRAIFVIDSVSWGNLCLHRAGLAYSDAEAAFVESITAHIAEGLRKALLLNSAEPTKSGGTGRADP